MAVSLWNYSPWNYSPLQFYFENTINANNYSNFLEGDFHLYWLQRKHFNLKHTLVQDKRPSHFAKLTVFILPKNILKTKKLMKCALAFPDIRDLCSFHVKHVALKFFFLGESGGATLLSFSLSGDSRCHLLWQSCWERCYPGMI